MVYMLIIHILFYSSSLITILPWHSCLLCFVIHHFFVLFPIDICFTTHVWFCYSSLTHLFTTLCCHSRVCFVLLLIAILLWYSSLLCFDRQSPGRHWRVPSTHSLPKWSQICTLTYTVVVYTVQVRACLTHYLDRRVCMQSEQYTVCQVNILYIILVHTPILICIRTLYMQIYSTHMCLVNVDIISVLSTLLVYH